MWMGWLLGFFLLGTPVFADPGFDEQYERDYNIFNPINQYRPDNPLNPINSVDPKNPFNPINSVDPGNPANPINPLTRTTHLIRSTKSIRTIRATQSIATIPTRHLSRYAR